MFVTNLSKDIMKNGNARLKVVSQDSARVVDRHLHQRVWVRKDNTIIAIQSSLHM